MGLTRPITRLVLGLLAAVLVGLCLWWGLRGAGGDGQAPGETLSPTASASRVVVIDPGVHEVLIRLGATGRMVGRPDYTDEFKETAALPTMGTGLSPSYEKIVRAGPDLILSTHASRGVVLDNLRKIAPTENLPWLTAPQVAQSVRAIGKLLSIDADADALAIRIEQGLAPNIRPDSPRVLVLLSAPSSSDTELWVIKPNSLHGAALEAAGGRHAIPEAIQGPPTLSIEGLMQIDPDIIVILIADSSTTPATLEGYRAFWDRFGMLSAVKNDQVGFMIGRTHFYTGPGVLEFKAALADKIAQVQARKP